MKDIELLQYVHETAEMGILGLQDIVGQVQTAKLKKSLQGQIAEYQTIASEAAKLLQAKGTAPKDPSLMARLSSEVMSTMQTLADSSDSKIAEMTIKGNNLGITKGLKHLHDYEGNDRQVRSLAEKLLSTEQANVEQMKPFL